FQRSVPGGAERRRLLFDFRLGFNRFWRETDSLPVRTSFQCNFLTGIDESVDDGLSDDGVLEELNPAPGIDLAGDDDGALPIPFLQDVHETGGFLVRVVSKAEVVQDQDLVPIKVPHIDEVAARYF